MAAITYKGESLIATKQAAGEVMNIDRVILANIPGLDPGKPVDRNEQLPPAEHIVLDDPVSQHGYINPNLVVYALHMGTGGEPFDFNWLGLYCSEDDTVVAINYMPTQGKDQSQAMTRNLILEFSGAQETGDIHVPAESWMVDFSQRMDGTDGRSRQMTQDMVGRQLFYGDACKVVKGSGGYYDLLPGESYVAGIRFDYPGKSVLISGVPTSIWLDVSQQGNAMSDIQPVVDVVVSTENLKDYVDGEIPHFLEKITDLKEDGSLIDLRKTFADHLSGSITHLKMSDAIADDNTYRNSVTISERSLAVFRKVLTQYEYDNARGKAPFTKFIDSKLNRFVLDTSSGTNAEKCGCVGDYILSDGNINSNPTDNTEPMQAFLDVCRGNYGFIPPGSYYHSKSVYQRKGSRIQGLLDEQWNTGNNASLGSNVGTRLYFEGNGNGARWTDIGNDVVDKADFKPALIFSGAGCVLSDVTICNIGDIAWDAGVYNPGLQRCFLERVNTEGKWQEGGYYIDATWGHLNTTLTELHPEIEAAAAPIECRISDCWLRGLWGLSVIGSQRDPKDPDNLPWVWSEPGTSDLLVDNCRLESDRWHIPESIRVNDGGCYRHDAATSSNSFGVGQGHFFTNCWFRTASKWAIKLDRANRHTMTGCYGEKNVLSFPNNPRFEVSSNTVYVSLINDALTAFSVYKDGKELVGNIPDLRPEHAIQANMTLLRSNGRFVNGQIFLTGGLNSTQPTEIHSPQEDGSVDLFHTTREGEKTHNYRASALSLRPATNGDKQLGTGGYKWEELYVLNAPVTQSDETLKDIEEIPEQWLNAAENIKLITFLWKSQVEKYEQGERQPARWHIGASSQAVYKAFIGAGVKDPFTISLMCRDIKEEQIEDGTVVPVLDDNGQPIYSWGLRYQELNSLLIACERRRSLTLENKIFEIEKSLGINQ